MGETLADVYAGYLEKVQWGEQADGAGPPDRAWGQSTIGAGRRRR